ncbi:cell division protein FtsL [Weissella cibaria]|uniref:cell division protein FtsL n=1 Tax=Weissella cibaria TaxID=137591 RepID=UPI00118F464D|nr:cell division protein FtsL [Weissella cibaria]TVV34461.1 cell division protein FtsL [Weissella cibaria]
MDAMPKYAGNTAPKKVNQPQRWVKTKTVRRPYEKPVWNAMDLTMAAAAVVTVAFMAFLVMFMASKGASANKQLQSTTTQLEQLRDKNNDLKQEVSSLSSPDRLGQVAEKHGLSLQNQNIRNVK